MSTQLDQAARTKPRSIVYIDGFNWYFSLFRHFPAWKWLNIESFFREMRNQEEIAKIKFFTALVHPQLRHSAQRERQKRYLSALSTLRSLEIILGAYQTRKVTCRADCRKSYGVPEEKKTDVNIAVHLLNDAVKGNAEKLIVVSGDSDIQPAIAWVKENYPGVHLHVYIPSLPAERKMRYSNYYGTIGVKCSFLPLERIGRHQLPAAVLSESGSVIERPKEWA